MSIDPRQAVVLGATLMAEHLVRARNPGLARAAGGIDLGGLRIIETCVLPLRTKIPGGLMSVIIEQGTVLPVTREEGYSTTSPGQTCAVIELLEGPWKVASRNRKQASLEVHGIPPARGDEPNVVVTYTLGEDGILDVSARCHSASSRPVRLRVDMAQHFSTERG
jgi:molecular chaperone DnaK (HSP70)